MPFHTKSEQRKNRRAASRQNARKAAVEREFVSRTPAAQAADIEAKKKAQAKNA